MRERGEDGLDAAFSECALDGEGKGCKVWVRLGEFSAVVAAHLESRDLDIRMSGQEPGSTPPRRIPMHR